MGESINQEQDQRQQLMVSDLLGTVMEKQRFIYLSCSKTNFSETDMIAAIPLTWAALPGAGRPRICHTTPHRLPP